MAFWESRFGRCPYCRDAHIRPSSIHSATDVICRFFLIKAYRCRTCFHRFRRFLPYLWIERSYIDRRSPPGDDKAKGETHAGQPRGKRARTPA
jgi:hypothetical protein